MKWFSRIVVLSFCCFTSLSFTVVNCPSISAETRRQISVKYNTRRAVLTSASYFDYWVLNEVWKTPFKRPKAFPNTNARSHPIDELLTICKYWTQNLPDEWALDHECKLKGYSNQVLFKRPSSSRIPCFVMVLTRSDNFIVSIMLSLTNIYFGVPR